MAVNRRYIKRSVTLSVCEGQRVNLATGELEDYSDVLVGCYTPERATRVIRRLTADQSVIVTHVEQETALYSMPIEKFIAEATREDR